MKNFSWKQTIGLILLAALVIAGGWYVYRQRSGADISFTGKESEGRIIPVSYNEIFSAKAGEMPFYYSDFLGEAWTISGNILYFARNDFDGTGGIGNLHVLGYNIDTGKKIDIVDHSDWKVGGGYLYGYGISSSFMATFMDKPYVFVSFPNNNITVAYKLDSGVWKKAGEIGDYRLGMSNDTLWNGYHDKIWLIGRKNTAEKDEKGLPLSQTKIVEYDFSQESFSVINGYNNVIKDYAYCKLIARGNNFLVSFAGCGIVASTASNTGGDHSVAYITAADERYTNYMQNFTETFYDHHNSYYSAIAKSGDDVYLFGSSLPPNIDNQGRIVSGKGISNASFQASEKVNISLNYYRNGSLYYPSERISSLPEGIRSLSAKTINGNVYLLGRKDETQDRNDVHAWNTYFKLYRVGISYSQPTSIVDNGPATITHTLITTHYTDQDLIIKATIKDDNPINAPLIIYSAYGTREEDNTLEMERQGNTDIYQITIPKVTFPEGVHEFVYGIKVTDAGGNLSFLEGTNNPWTGGRYWQRVRILPVPKDTTPPVVTHTPVGKQDATSDLVVKATVTDNVGVKEANLYYMAGTPNTKPTAKWQKVAMAKKDSDNYEGVISKTAFVKQREIISYYLEAIDAAGNRAVSPLTAPAEFYKVNLGGWPVEVTNTPPTVTINSKRILRSWRITGWKFRLVADWTGSDKEDKTGLVYRRKIDNGSWSAWESATLVDTGYTLTGGVSHTVTVQVKDKGGLTAEATK